MEIKINTTKYNEAIDITEKVQECVTKKAKAVLVYCPHTTAGLTINEGYDNDVMLDIVDAIDEIEPKADYRHKEGNSQAHVKSAITGVNLCIPVEDGKLKLGKWQKIFFMEFDGPEERTVWVECL